MTNSGSQVSNTRHMGSDSGISYMAIVVCYLIIILAFALRLYQLNADSLWGDEIFTATQSPLPVGELLDWTAGDIHPPGYYLMMGWLANGLGWVHVIPSALTDWLWRFPSVLAGTLAVALTYRLGVDLLNRWVGLGAALLLVLSPVAIQYSQEARMHALFLLGATLSTWTLGRALAKPSEWQWWLAYALATALSMYAVYLAFVVLAAQAGWVIVSQISNHEYQISNFKSQISDLRSPILGWLVSVVFAFVLYLPWWPTLIGIVSRRLTTGDVNHGVGAPLAFLVQGVHSLGPGPGWVAWLFLGLWGIGTVSVVARHDLALAVFGVLWLALPLALPLVFRDPRALHVRYVFLLPVYLLFVVQGGMMLVVGGWWLVTGKWRAIGIRGIRESEDWEIGFAGLSIIHLFSFFVLLGLVLTSVLFLPGYYRRTKPDWRGAGAYLVTRTIPGDVIVTGPLFDVGRYLDYYYDGPAELIPPALLVAGLPQRVASMRTSGGRVWAVTRFRPAPMAAVQSVEFPGLTVSEPVVPVYEPDLIAAAMVDLMQQAVAATPGWAADMSSEGVMAPDPLVARAAAYLFLGDVYREAGDLPQAVAAYEAMVADYPTSAGGYVTLAEAYEAVHQPEAAVRAYRRAVALNPAWGGPRADEADSLADAGRWAEAAAVYGEVVR
jgi:4-amino-4-deoxy-L-arabinose transferase-like glycosyltransferase